MQKSRFPVLIGAACLAAALGACSSSNAPSQLTDADAQQVGGVMVDELSQVIASFTSDGLTGPTPSAAFSRAVLGAPPQTPPGPCPAVDNLTDTDGDGVPDNATFTFNAADCSGPGYQVTGVVHLIDPSADPQVVGYVGTLTNLRTEVTGQGNDHLIVTLDGSHGVVGTSTTGTLTEDLVTTIDAVVGQETLSGSLHNAWTTSFTAAQGQALEMASVLPSGGLMVGGTTSWRVNGQSFSFTMETPTALAYDASCNDPSLPFSTGRSGPTPRGTVVRPTSGSSSRDAASSPRFSCSGRRADDDGKKEEGSRREGRGKRDWNEAPMPVPLPAPAPRSPLTSHLFPLPSPRRSGPPRRPPPAPAPGPRWSGRPPRRRSW